MLNKKQKVVGIIEEVQPNGLGAFNYQKNRVFMKHVLKGEKIEGIVSKKIKEGYIADVKRIIEPSSIRTKVTCSHFGKCGSCNYLHMLYPFELKKKTDEMKDLVKKNRMNIHVHNCEGMKQPYAYRNKTILSFSRNRKGETIAGFYEASSHNIVNIDRCLLHDNATNDLLHDIKAVVKKCRLDIYDENRKTGFLRHVLVRKNKNDEFMVVIVSATKEFKGKKNFIQELLAKNKSIKTIVQNVNKRQTSVVLGNEEYVLYGKGYIEDELCNLTFKISPSSFYQINPVQCEVLYTKAIDLLELKGDETVLDAYCGIGTIGMIAAKQAKSVIGVELNKRAIQDANQNKELNNVENIEFIAEDAGVFLQGLAIQKKKIDALIMDPTRDGSSEEFLQAVLKIKPKQIVYISCNPQTQIRDLKTLSKDYTFKDMYLYDMFPRTSHVESIVLLSRVEK